MGFFLEGEVLYKKRKDELLLRCVDASEAKKIVHEIHEGVCGTHASACVMARQIMRAEYSAYIFECNGVTVTFLNIGQGCDRTYNPENLKWPSFHLCNHRLLY